MGSDNNSRVVAAPQTLDISTREAFRESAMRAVESLEGDSGLLIIDLSATCNVDTAGLATLAFLHRKASERRAIVRLRSASDEIRFSLVLARLEELFELEVA